MTVSQFRLVYIRQRIVDISRNGSKFLPEHYLCGSVSLFIVISSYSIIFRYLGQTSANNLMISYHISIGAHDRDREHNMERFHYFQV